MTKGQVCLSQKYCTDCPLRKDCTVRSIFYSETEYFYWRKQAYDTTVKMASFLSLPPTIIASGTICGIQMMDKRRARELELYPKYSPE